MDDGVEPALSIGDVAERAGIGEGTLRSWEARYAFPKPRRLPSGHRRYSELDVKGVNAVLHARAEGLSLPGAIHRARRAQTEARPSVYAAVRERFPHLHPQLLPKPALLWLSHAIEDECAARAAQPLLLGCFQRERFYRHAERRWSELARTAGRAVVLADFPRFRKPRHGPVEVPIPPTEPVLREWVLVCDAPQFSGCLVGWERPSGGRTPRRFETVWTVEPDIVREAAHACCDIVHRSQPPLADDLRDGLSVSPVGGASGQLRLAVDLATRVTVYASGQCRD